MNSDKYWLELLLEGGYTDNKTVLEHCLEVKKILIASINTVNYKVLYSKNVYIFFAM